MMRAFLRGLQLIISMVKVTYIFSIFILQYIIKMCSYLEKLECLEKSETVLELGDESLYINFFPTKNNQKQIKTEYIREHTIMGVERKMYSQRYVNKKIRILLIIF